MKQFKLFITIVFLSCVIKLEGQWTSISSFPTTTDGAFSFVIGNKAYVNGGIANNDFYEYNETTTQWTKLTDVPSTGTNRAWAFSFAANGKGYIVGGAYETASDLESDCWEYNPATNSWLQKADFPGDIRDAGYSFAINNKGYVGGGFDGAYLHNDLYEYDPATDSWTKKADFPGGAVIFPSSFVINNKAYVGLGEQNGNEINDIWEYDPAKNSWKQVADFPGDKRQTAFGFAIGQKGYIGGGMADYAVNRNDFWQYDPHSNQWSMVSTAGYPATHTAWSTGFVIGYNVYFGLGVTFPAFTFSADFYKMDFTKATTVSAVANASGLFVLYPNPANGELRLSGNVSDITGIQILDVTGAVCKRLEGMHEAIDIAGLAGGVYTILIEQTTGIFNSKFIKME